jgi:hypothetical protein
MKYLPFSMASNGEYAAQSLASAHELGHLPDSKRRALFSRVRYYPPPIDLGDERSAPARKDTKTTQHDPRSESALPVAMAAVHEQPSQTKQTKAKKKKANGGHKYHYVETEEGHAI